MYDSDYIGAQFVNLAMDVTFSEKCRHRQTVRIHRLAVEIEFQNVFRDDELGRNSARHEKTVWVAIVPKYTRPATQITLQINIAIICAVLLRVILLRLVAPWTTTMQTQSISRVEDQIQEPPHAAAILQELQIALL